MTDRITISLISVCILLSGCEQVVKTSLYNHDPVMVANGFLAPDSTAWIKLTNSRPVTSGVKMKPIPNADLTLVVEDGAEYSLEYVTNYGDYDSKTSYYRSSELDIIPGAKFSLKGKHDRYPTISSEVTIPASTSWETAQLVQVDTLNSSSQYENTELLLDIELSLSDNLKADDYYAFFVYSKRTSQVENPDTSYTRRLVDILNFETADPAITQEYYNFTNSIFDDGKVEFKEEAAYFTDEMFNGKNKTINISTNCYIYDSSFEHLLEIRMLHISREMYLYAKSLRKSNQESSGLDIPVGEPARVYSNIDNGLGIFGAFTALADTIQLLR